MNRSLSDCPVCDHPLVVTELSCPSCHTRVQGVFHRCRFCALPDKQNDFLTVFLRNRGNLSAVGEELGLSYPTVGRRLDALLAALNLRETVPARPANRPNAAEAHRKHILEMLDKGEITAEEAAQRLRDL